MLLGLITDIHEHTAHLQAALAEFTVEGVDQVVVIGDLFEMGKSIHETCCLLSDAGAIGVWGNHDIGLCRPNEEVRTKYSPETLKFMKTLKARLLTENCYFSHIEPWLNPEELSDLWYLNGPPDSNKDLNRIFNSCDHRYMFSGHYHRWLLSTPDRIHDWSGYAPVSLKRDRSFVVVGALCEGRFATFDTETCVLTPFNIDAVC